MLLMLFMMPGLVCLHYVGFIFGRLCLVGNCAEPLGKVDFSHTSKINLIVNKDMI